MLRAAFITDSVEELLSDFFFFKLINEEIQSCRV